LLVAIVILVFCGAMCSFFGRNVGQLASTALLVAIVLLLHLWSDGPVLWPECLPTCIISLARCDCYFVSLVVRWVRFFAEIFASSALLVAIVILFRLLCDGYVLLPTFLQSCINSLDRCDCAYYSLVVRWARFWQKIWQTCINIIVRCYCSSSFLVVRCARFCGRNVGQLALTALIVAIVMFLILWCGGPVFWQSFWPTCINSLARCDCSYSSLVVRWARFLAEILANLHQQPCSLRLLFVFSWCAIGQSFGRNFGQLASTALLVAIVNILIVWCGGAVFLPKCWHTCINSFARCDCSSY
jgi:hypothetical protein